MIIISVSLRFHQPVWAVAVGMVLVGELQKAGQMKILEFVTLAMVDKIVVHTMSDMISQISEVWNIYGGVSKQMIKWWASVCYNINAITHIINMEWCINITGHIKCEYKRKGNILQNKLKGYLTIQEAYCTK